MEDSNKVMEDVSFVKRKVIKHDNFHFGIGKISPNDKHDIPVTMSGFSIETKIYFQEWVGWSDSPIEPNRYIKILEGPYSYTEYCSVYNDVQYASEERMIESFENGLSPDCNKYNYYPCKEDDFQRIITKHCTDGYNKETK